MSTQPFSAQSASDTRAEISWARGPSLSEDWVDVGVGVGWVGGGEDGWREQEGLEERAKRLGGVGGEVELIKERTGCCLCKWWGGLPIFGYLHRVHDCQAVLLRQRLAVRLGAS